MKKALITGITGQDGSYLAELLLEKGYEVHGIIRRSSSFNTRRIDHLINNTNIFSKKLFLYHGDLVDTSNLNRILEKTEPDEIYNLAAQSHVRVSFEIPDYTSQVDALGTLRFLDALREVGLGKHVKFYQASTSELFGNAQEIPQKETTPFYPRSPYGVAKLYGYWIVKNYREAYNLFAANGILFNHESPRRGETFVTRKITRAAVRILFGLQKKLSLGNIDAKRDWGYAPEYCEGMWKMLQQDQPEDFILATGETHSIREFCEAAFKEIGVEIEWIGKGENEKGIIKAIASDRISVISRQLVEKEKRFSSNRQSPTTDNQQLKVGDEIISIDPIYYRPSEVDLLVGDYSKAKEKLGWEPNVRFEHLVELMMNFDLFDENIR